jgi:cob(I)alamin adenosyltransferase
MIEAKASAVALQFVNRLSDYLFVLARYLAYKSGEEEIMWKK